MTIVTIKQNDIDIPALQIADYIKEQLGRNKTVLWLLPGGSAITVAVRARQLLGTIPSGSVLHVALTDERYGEVNHVDSNYRQLQEAGFDVSGLKLHSILINQDIETTSHRYSKLLGELLQESSSVIGLFGMGTDGHTAGLLPGNHLMNSQNYAGYYEAFDFQRITTTPYLFKSIDEVVLYAVGDSKWPIIKQLHTTELPVSKLKLAKNVMVYSDYKKGEL